MVNPSVNNIIQCEKDSSPGIEPDMQDNKQYRIIKERGANLFINILNEHLISENSNIKPIKVGNAPKPSIPYFPFSKVLKIADKKTIQINALIYLPALIICAIITPTKSKSHGTTYTNILQKTSSRIHISIQYCLISVITDFMTYKR